MAVQGMVMKPIRIATSKPAQQTYLNTLLFTITATILFGAAATAYLLLYWNYIPKIGVEKVVHLQFGDGPHPYGFVQIDSIIPLQDYDVALTLDLPRSPTNVNAGNFMVSLRLLSSEYKPTLTMLSDFLSNPLSSSTASAVLYSSRRPAIITYQAALTTLSQRLLALPLYVLALGRESEVIKITLAERLSFPRSWSSGSPSLPSTAFIELQAPNLDVYSASLSFQARFTGLRWFMYNYRIASFAVFTSAFWAAEILAAGLTWLVFSFVWTGKPDGKGKSVIKTDGNETDGSVTVKQETTAGSEEVDLSDTPRTFPTYGRQQPLSYEPKVKEEQTTAETAIQPLAMQGSVGAEADDESEDVDDGHRGRWGGRSDSGLGTSYSETGGGSADVLRRRRSKNNKQTRDF